jgi:hypothetical protein
MNGTYFRAIFYEKTLMTDGFRCENCGFLGGT